MNFISESLGDLVQTYLEKSKALRDDDKRLLINVWAKQLNRELTQVEKALLKEIAESKQCSVPESISRARREIQKFRTDLRGERYHERQESQNEVVDQARRVGQQSLFN